MSRKSQSNTSFQSYRFILWTGVGLLIGLIIYLLFRSAWVSDDAYITFRSVDNLLSGYGLRWNPKHRVQTYTHPLWMMVMIPVQALFGEPRVPVMILGIFFSLGAIGLFVWRFRSNEVTKGADVPPNLMLLPLLAAFAGSKAFIDFSTSGLENPLSFVLSGLFLFCFLNHKKAPSLRGLVVLGLMFSLILLNRMDLGLIFVFPIGWYAFQVFWGQKVAWWKVLGILCLTMLPFIAWETFSLLYYGFPFPNTYYAKIRPEISWGAYLKRGLFYYWDALLHDRVTVLVLVVGAPVVVLRKEARSMAVLMGILAYLMYVLRIGGDFMGSRFFSVPVVAMLFLLIDVKWKWKRPGLWAGVIAALVLAVGVSVPNPTFLYADSDHIEGPITGTGIVDERMYYYQATGLWAESRRTEGQMKGAGVMHNYANIGRELRAADRDTIVDLIAVGFSGYYAGPKVHIIDPLGICDPLLARTNMKNEPWRIGHIFHEIPKGYRESIETGENLIRDPEIAELYEALLPKIYHPKK